MTVCIAAIAEQGQAIVMLADRAISSVRGGQTVLKADAGVRKLRELRGGWAGAMSGPIDFGERALFLADDSYAISSKLPDPASRLGMPECTKTAYQSCRKVLVIDQILRPRLLDEDWYSKKVAGSIPRDDAHFKEIAEAEIDSTLLLCGFENNTPEIYIISDPGILNSASPEGFGVIGIGQDAAMSRLFTLETDPSDELGKVLYDAYDAKESCAELLPEVGHEWDALVLIRDRETIQVPTEICNLIEELYRGHPVSPFDKASARPKAWRSRLRAFASEALGRNDQPGAEPTQEPRRAQRDW